MIIDMIFRTWHELPFTVIDFETTGLEEHDRAVQVAAVRFENGEQVAQHSTLIDPEMPIPDEASKIHGIYYDDVKGAPTLSDAIAEVANKVPMADALPVAYNAQFDRRFWLPDFTYPGLVFDVLWPWVDPLVFIRHAHKFWRGKGRHKLANVAEKYNVDPGDSHTAIDDAITTGRILFSERMHKILGDVSIAELLRKQQLRAQEQEVEFKQYLAAQEKEEKK
jgi:DNA polymerase III epsilon subunit-like protein